MSRVETLTICRRTIRALAVLAVLCLAANTTAIANETAKVEAWVGTLTAGKSTALPQSGSLDVAKLDYSVESLKSVDAYLAVVQAALPKGADGHGDLAAMERRDLNAIIFQVGGYVGEVIRRKSEGRYEWYSHREWLAMFPKQAELVGSEPSLGTVLVLGTRDGSFMLPLGKVGKFLTNGIEDSTHFFAQVAVKDRTTRNTREPQP